MPVRTTRVDVSALARSQPLTSSRARTAGGSYGLGLARGVTGFVFDQINPLIDREEISDVIALFTVDQADAVYALADDANGRFFILIDEDTGAPLLDGDGYVQLCVSELEPQIEDVEYTVVIRVSWGGSHRDFTRTLPVEPGAPLDYSLISTETSFDAAYVTGQGVTDIVPVDNRAQIDSVVLTDDAEGLFAVVNRNNVVRTAAPIVEGDYTLVATVTFMDGHVETGFTFSLNVYSVG